MIWFWISAPVVLYSAGWYFIGLRHLAPRYLERKVAERLESIPRLLRSDSYRLECAQQERDWNALEANMIAIFWPIAMPVQALARMTRRAIEDSYRPHEVELEARRTQLQAEITRLENENERLRKAAE